MNKKILFFLSSMLLLSLAVYDVPFAQAEISGIVKDYFGNPIEGVQVKIKYSRLTGLTDEQGKYSVKYLPGSFTVLYSKPGYSRYEISLNLATKETFPAEDVTLCKLPSKPGAYFFTRDGFIGLKENRIGVAGTFLQSISGIASLSGNIAPVNPPAIILYGNRLSSKEIYVSKLRFRHSALVQNITGKTRSDIDMWTIAQEVPFELSKYGADEYLAVLRAKHPLEDGNYALSFGALHAGNPLDASAMQKAVMDFQVGTAPPRTLERNPKVEAEKKAALKETISRIESRVKRGSGTGGTAGGTQTGITIQIYKVEVETLIKSNWAYPAAFMDFERRGNLEALVVVKVSRDGSILDTRFEKKSSNPAFDQSVREAIKKSNPLPPFPEGYLKTHEDIEISFVLTNLEEFGSGSPNSGELFLSQSYVLTDQQFEKDQDSKSYPINLAEKSSIAVLSAGPMDLKGILRDQYDNVIVANNGYRDIGPCVCSPDGAQQTPASHENRNFMLRAFDLSPGKYSIEVSPDEDTSSTKGKFSLIFLRRPTTTIEFFNGMRALLGDRDSSNDYLDIYIKALFKEYYADVNDIESVNYTDTLCFGGVGRERQCKALVNFYLKNILGKEKGLLNDCTISNSFASNDPDYLLVDPATTIYNSFSNFGNMDDAEIGDVWVKKVSLTCDGNNYKSGFNHYGLYCDPGGIILDANAAGDGRLNLSTERKRNTGTGWKIARIKLGNDSMLQKAKELEKQGKLEEAVDVLKQSITLSPGNEAAQNAYLRLRLKVMESSKMH